ncbi:helix-turn-helix domain-containing protein [Sinomicrobium weinanense]|uniref:Helix-turn-helix domain-containing protein n=1 Tax=Sinomicrobium weinanense TaxID=2842200 RepID=A0A926Q355_9FLAO|nr:helix-turn-helix domain-containing protein [Sinomicrobium weinanense]MBC9797213.1 helix-turn-helix domain-containing protein [Sinomicrobium weinanense]MBU3122723.1 helix-turn-helix domain containing protein [Sinomicrobium weinanense]
MEKRKKTGYEQEHKKTFVKETFSAEDILQNLKDYFGFKTNLELADFLGVKPNTISTWKKRNTLDYYRLITIGKLHNVDFNKLFSHHIHEQNSIIVVPVELQYQYVSQREDQGFINNLPRYQFPFAYGEGARAFQVTDFSTFSTFTGVSYVVGNRVQGLDAVVEGGMYVFVNKVQGIFTGRVERDRGTDDIIYVIPGDNKILPGKIKMIAKNIVEIWKVHNVIFHDLVD